MTTSNHILAGALIALTVHEPVLIVPLAFASHFILDALPHYGYEGDGYKEALKYKLTYVMEALGFIGFVLLAVSGVFEKNFVMIAAFFAVLPDFEWPYRYVFFERKGLKPPSTFMTRFHQNVQWCERSWGIIPEVVFFIVGYTIIITIV